MPSMVRRSSAGRPPAAGQYGRRWQEWLDERPLVVRQMNPAHASRLVHSAGVLEPPLDYLERWMVSEHRMTIPTVL
jgi:hypothetical protein